MTPGQAGLIVLGIVAYLGAVMCLAIWIENKYLDD